jgi:RNA polymerase-binding transcription factor DksA
MGKKEINKSKKTISKKATNKKVVAKKAITKKAVTKKAVTKKTVAKKPVVKKVVAKKAVAKKVVAKKPVVKKTVAKKVVAEKPVIKKKAVAKEIVAKKIESKKVVNKKPESKKVVMKETPKVTVKETQETSEKIRYNDKELLEFKNIILKKLEEARRDLILLTEAYTTKNDNDTNDTSPTFKVLEEGSNVLSKEENSQLAARQQKFIRDLESALLRIENKTYGICRVTGKLIPKERLLVVPHATMSIEAKLLSQKQNK